MKNKEVEEILNDASNELHDTSLNPVYEYIDGLEEEEDRLKARISELYDDTSGMVSEVADLERELRKYQQGSASEIQPDNRDRLFDLVVNPKTVTDELSIKALANLFRNLTLEEIEAIDDQKRLECKLKGRTYITYP